MTRSVVILCLLTLSPLGGCSREKPPPAAKREPSAATTPSDRAATPAAALSRAAPSASVAEPPAPAPLPVKVAEAPLPAKLTLVRAERGYGVFRLHALQGAFLASRGMELYRYENGQLVPQALGFVAEHTLMGFEVIRGRYPDALSGTALVGSRMQSDRGDYFDYQTQDFYGPIDALVSESTELPGGAFSQGSRLVYRNQSFLVVRGAKNQVVPRVTDDGAPSCAAAFPVRAFDSSSDGAVVAAGPSCRDPGQLLVERWSSGKADGRLSQLPSAAPFPEKTEISVVLGAANQAIVMATSSEHSAFWREAPEGWQELATPASPEPSSIAVSASGDVWLVSRPSAHKHERPRAFVLSAGTWRSVAVSEEGELRRKLGNDASPEPLWLSPANFAIRGDQVYLAANIVRGNDQQVGIAVLEPEPPSAAASPSAASATAPSDCTPQVVLFGVTPTTPPDYRYPATQDALLGSPVAKRAELLEVSRSGKRTIVLKAATAADAEALAALVRTRIAGSKPAVVCEPITEILRKIPLE